MCCRNSSHCRKNATHLAPTTCLALCWGICMHSLLKSAGRSHEEEAAIREAEQRALIPMVTQALLVT